MSGNRSRRSQKAGRAAIQEKGKAVSPGSCCHDNSLQGCGLSLGDLRKPRVGFWFRDSCSLVRLYFCGRYRVPLPSERLSSTAPQTPWRSGFPLQGPSVWTWSCGVLPSPAQRLPLLLLPLHSFLMTPMAVLWSQDLLPGTAAGSVQPGLSGSPPPTPPWGK